MLKGEDMVKEFKLEPCDIFLHETEGNGFIPTLSRWAIGPYGHVSMFVGDCNIGEGFNKVPLVFQSIEKGAGLYSLESMTGELVLVLRPQINSYQELWVISNSIDIASCPKSFYDYPGIIRYCMPRVLHEKFPWLPITVFYYRGVTLICSEAIAECFWRASIEILPQTTVPLPGDFVTSLILTPAYYGRLMLDILP
jgi:hypothetical protein